jgi:hypothetical protein
VLNSVAFGQERHDRKEMALRDGDFVGVDRKKVRSTISRQDEELYRILAPGV